MDTLRATWSEGAKQYDQLKSASYHARSTRKKHQRVASDFDKIVNGKPLEEVSLGDVELYVAGRLALGRSRWSVHDDIVKLRVMFRWLRRRGLMSHDPSEWLEPIHRPSPDPQPPALTTYKRFLRWLKAHGHETYAQMLTLVANLGPRLREMLRLTVRDVDLFGRTVAIKSVKPPYRTEKLDLNAPAYRTMKTLVAHAEGGLLFRTRTGREIHRRNAARRLQQLTGRAGVSGITFHSLRKLYGSRNGERYTDRELMRLMRHSSTGSLGHYIRVQAPLPVAT